MSYKWRVVIGVGGFVLLAAAAFGMFIYGIVDGSKIQRMRERQEAVCRKAIDRAEHFRTTTRPRICPEDSVECRKLERELFLAVVVKCAKVVK